MVKKFALFAPFLVLAATLATAQTAPPPPAWQQGRKADMADSQLAPHAGKLTATPASDIPVQNLKLPAGFKAE